VNVEDNLADCATQRQRLIGTPSSPARDPSTQQSRVGRVGQYRQQGKTSVAVAAGVARVGWLDHFPDLMAIDGVPQDAVWHPVGSVEIHTAQSVDAAAALCDQDGIDGPARTLTVLAALVHDLGKATHTRVQSNGRITSH
jgi:hypothetical protein